MKEIPLTQGQVALVDAADFEWLNQWKWTAHRFSTTYYAVRATWEGAGRRTYVKMHRLILGLTDPKILGDHRDRNGLNNCRANLRAASALDSSHNKNKRAGMTSKYLGVSKIKGEGRFRAVIRTGGVYRSLGCYIIEEDAARAFDRAALAFYGDFASLNFPISDYTAQPIQPTATQEP